MEGEFGKIHRKSTIAKDLLKYYCTVYNSFSHENLFKNIFSIFDDVAHVAQSHWLLDTLKKKVLGVNKLVCPHPGPLKSRSTFVILIAITCPHVLLP